MRMTPLAAERIGSHLALSANRKNVLVYGEAGNQRLSLERLPRRIALRGDGDPSRYSRDESGRDPHAGLVVELHDRPAEDLALLERGGCLVDLTDLETLGDHRVEIERAVLGPGQEHREVAVRSATAAD